MNRDELMQDVLDATAALEFDRVALELAKQWVKKSEEKLKDAKHALESLTDKRTLSEKVEDIAWDNYLAANDKN